MIWLAAILCLYAVFMIGTIFGLTIGWWLRGEEENEETGRQHQRESRGLRNDILASVLQFRPGKRDDRRPER
jgi:hypothetical protein